MDNLKAPIIFLVILVMPFTVWSGEQNREEIKGLDEQVQDIKKEVLAISAELTLLEEKLLYPSNTQVSLFISLVKESQYIPDAIHLKLDNKDVMHHIYSYKEVGALQRGGVQRIYTGNLKAGYHKLEVKVIGKHNSNDSYSESAVFTINKDVGAKLVEISLGSEDSLIDVKE